MGGSEIVDGATKYENERILMPVSGELEGTFRVVLDTRDLKTDEVIKSDIQYEVEDIWSEVTVTYDIDTMEVLSIVQ